jgi:hypothetical protein
VLDIRINLVNFFLLRIQVDERENEKDRNSNRKNNVAHFNSPEDNLIGIFDCHNSETA